MTKAYKDVWHDKDIYIFEVLWKIISKLCFEITTNTWESILTLSNWDKKRRITLMQHIYLFLSISYHDQILCIAYQRKISTFVLSSLWRFTRYRASLAFMIFQSPACSLYKVINEFMQLYWASTRATLTGGFSAHMLSNTEPFAMDFIITQPSTPPITARDSTHISHCYPNVALFPSLARCERNGLEVESSHKGLVMRSLDFLCKRKQAVEETIGYRIAGDLTRHDGDVTSP